MEGPHKFAYPRRMGASFSSHITNDPGKRNVSSYFRYWRMVAEWAMSGMGPDSEIG